MYRYIQQKGQGILHSMVSGQSSRLQIQVYLPHRKVFNPLVSFAEEGGGGEGKKERKWKERRAGGVEVLLLLEAGTEAETLLGWAGLRVLFHGVGTWTLWEPCNPLTIALDSSLGSLRLIGARLVCRVQVIWPVGAETGGWGLAGTNLPEKNGSSRLRRDIASKELYYIILYYIILYYTILYYIMYII